MTDAGVHKLGEVLRAAREAKGVDLTRVERDTKIRERYLSALERGEYRELPGAVYTKGFLRNYGAYLGLDPEYLIDLYRLETSGSAAERARRRQPAAPDRRAPLAGRFVVTPGCRGRRPSSPSWSAPSSSGSATSSSTSPARRSCASSSPPATSRRTRRDTITIRGVTAADATITVSGLPENPSVTADADGNFEITVGPAARLERHPPRRPATR